MIVLAIDPGNEESAYVILNSNPLNIIDKGKVSNLVLERMIINDKFSCGMFEISEAGIETVSSYGMAVGQTILDTCFWSGRFQKALAVHVPKVNLIFRKTIKMHINQTVRAKDGEVTQVLTDKYGYDSTKKDPNPFYETPNGAWINGDIYAALALATYMIEPKDYPLKNLMETEENKLAKSLTMGLDEHVKYLADKAEEKRALAKKRK